MHSVIHRAVARWIQLQSRYSPCGPHGVCLQTRYIPCGRTVIAGSVSVRDL